MLSKLNAFAAKFLVRQDLMLVALFVVTIAAMVLPLPTVLIDALLALNISLTIFVLMLAIYLEKPLQFSTLPAVLLISAAFRLALSISTTRLILVQADAGRIIETFGKFVVAGNVVVGLVVFLIITVVQFVVITKGAERVAEVGARFTLDALPGKQLSIEAELRSGEIDGAEGQRKREELDKESQFFGAMDGAMKFVKGDAIAGLVIIAVNILGGMAVGTLQKGMSAGEAAEVYTLLTVGDGLVAQIPALIMALSAGAIVTRVTSQDTKDLGTDIVHQFTADRRILRVAAPIIALVGLVPGFPFFTFLAIALVVGGLAYLFEIRPKKGEQKEPEAAETKDEATEAAEKEEDEKSVDASEGDLFVVRLSPALAKGFERSAYAAQCRDEREEATRVLGMQPPLPGITTDQSLEGLRFEVDLDGVPLFSSEIPEDSTLAVCDQASLELAEVPAEKLTKPWTIHNGYWIANQHRGKVEAIGATTLSTSVAVAHAASLQVRNNAARAVDQGLIRAIHDEVAGSFPELAEEVERQIPAQKQVEVIRELVEERVPLRPYRLIYEALAEWADREDDPKALAEYVRSALGRQICHSYADGGRVIAVYFVEPAVERALRESIRQTTAGGFLVLNEETAAQLLENLNQLADREPEDGRKPVVCTAMDVRRYLRNYLVKNGIDLPVLAYEELAPDFEFFPLGSVKLGDFQIPDDEAA